jgi:uncharacterized protein
VIYLDTSAAAKALIREAESDGIRLLFDRDDELVGSRLVAVELHAVVDRCRLRAVDARALLDRVALASLTEDDELNAAALRHGIPLHELSPGVGAG